MVQVKFNDMKSSVDFKSCSLHDLMRDLSISEAEAKGFFKVIDLREKNDFHLRPSADFRSSNTRQLVVHAGDGYRSKKSYDYFGKKANQKRYRSMLLFNKFGTRSLPPAARGSHIANFRYLRVLSLEGWIRPWRSCSISRINLGRVLATLVYLRYLRVSYGNLLIFPSIQKLMLLETLRLGVKNIGSKLRFIGLSKLETLENFDSSWCEVKDLPKLIGLQKLTLKVYCRDIKEMLENLATVALSSSSCLRYLELTIIALRQELQNSQEMLRILLWDYNFNLQKLEITGKLPELALIFEQQPQQLLPTQMDVSLIRITKLELWLSRLEEDPMPELEKIATLRELKLYYEAYMGKKMVCSAMGFPKLTHLSLWALPNLVKWRIEEGSMCILNYLYISASGKLEEFPEGLRFLNSLDELKLVNMPSELCDRVCVVNGEQGPDSYKVAHIPILKIFF